MREDSSNRNTRLEKLVRKFISPAAFAAASALLLTVGVGAQSPKPQSSDPMAGKTAAQVFKNIQVLKDVPADQLIPGMRYITTALGVKCDYCHVNPWAKDTKPTKDTARRMMTMLFAINKDNFDGRPEVSCYTCHQGHSEPMGLPALSAEAAKPQFSLLAAGAPSLTAVLDKFTQAQGGELALNKITTRVLQLQETRDGNTSQVQIYQKAPGKMYSVSAAPGGALTAGFDGAHGWTSSNEGLSEASGTDAIILSLQAQINPSAAISEYKPKRLFGAAKVGDATAYVVIATAPDGSQQLLFFDQQTGLLIRRMVRYRTVFGALPVEADYSDYRTVDGVSIPYKTEWRTNGQSWSYTVTGVKDNVPVDDSKFDPPQVSQ